MSDAQVAEALAQMAALRSNLAALKAKQASLEETVRKSKASEDSLRGELSTLLRQGAELQREDVEHLIYTDEGWGPWEGDFRSAWDPYAALPPLAEGMPIVGGDRPPPWPRGSLGGETAPDRPPRPPDEVFIVSERPLMVMVPNFASEEECQGLIELGFKKCKPHNKWAQEAQRPGEKRAKGAGGPVRGVATASLRLEDVPENDRPLLELMQRRVAALTGIPDHGNEIRPFLKFDQPGEGRTDLGVGQDDLSIGLHIDTNGGFKHCACSVILYLNSCEGGRTVFPCAGDAESRALGTEISAAGHTHTSNERVHKSGLSEQAARLVERAEVAPGALRVSPRRGMAVLFFSLLGEEASQGATVDAGSCDASPAPDPWSWHGGSAVCGTIGKWTLQIFKEVPLEHRNGSADEAEYVAGLRRRVLEAVGNRAEPSGLADHIVFGSHSPKEAEEPAEQPEAPEAFSLTAMD